MNTTHTPGPWKLEPEHRQDGVHVEVLDQNDSTVATVEGLPVLNDWSHKHPELNHWAEGKEKTQIERSETELQANARLIAAAPRLLEMLQLAELVIINCAGDFPHVQRALTTIQKAIAEARGDQAA